MSVQATLQVALASLLFTDVDGDAQARVEALDAHVLALTSGDGAGAASKIFRDEFNIAASGNVAYDLDAGSLLDQLGAALTFATVKLVLIITDDENTNDVQATSSGGLSIGDGIDVRPGGVLALAVGPSDADAYAPGTLTLTNSAGGTAVRGTLVVIGT